jgi:hypothetical protein
VADVNYTDSAVVEAVKEGAVLVFDEVDLICGAVCEHDGHCVLPPGHNEPHFSGYCTWPTMVVVHVWTPGSGS